MVNRVCACMRDRRKIRSWIAWAAPSWRWRKSASVIRTSCEIDKRRKKLDRTVTNKKLMYYVMKQLHFNNCKQIKRICMTVLTFFNARTPQRKVVPRGWLKRLIYRSANKVGHLLKKPLQSFFMKTLNGKIIRLPKVEQTISASAENFSS